MREFSKSDRLLEMRRWPRTGFFPIARVVGTPAAPVDTMCERTGDTLAGPVVRLDASVGGILALKVAPAVTPELGRMQASVVVSIRPPLPSE